MKYFLFAFLVLTVVTSFAQNMTIQLTSPSPNERFDVCSDIQLAADVTIQSGDIRRVIFYAEDDVIRADAQAPYEATWTSVPDGIYQIYAKVVDDAGNEVSTDMRLVFVGNVQEGNMIINGEFNCGLSPWFLDNYVNAQSTALIVPDLWLTDDSSGVVVEIENQGDEFWAIQLMQPFQIQEGHTYEVTFTAQADAPKEIHIDISKNYDDYAPLHSFTVTVDQAKVYGPFNFTAAADDDNLMFKFVLGGNTIPIEIDAVNVIDQQWTSVAAGAQRDKSFTLSQNYPNPFNPTTTIRYTLDKPGLVSLSIYNIMGQKIKSFNRTETSGQHTFAWDGTMSSGADAPSGVYIYRLDTEHGSLAKKMHLVR
jgi:hypothetical protein